VPLLIALWLAVLHALVATPAARTPAADARAHAGASLHRSGSEPLNQTVHAAHSPAGVVATRGEAPSGHAPPAAPIGTAPRLDDAAARAAAVRGRALDASHAVTARGAVLPFFPTAPPLQG
jgi:hypothetical protein